MPAKAEWLLRPPQLLVALRVLDIPVVDRAAIQRLFGFQRRRAIQFMHELDGYKAGYPFLVDRMRLIAQLDVLLNGAGFLAFIRKACAEETVDGSRRRAVAARILVERGAWDTRIRSLPAGIRLEPGSLRVEFRDSQELLQKALRLGPGDYRRF